jgi:putative membrane protein
MKKNHCKKMWMLAGLLIATNAAWADDNAAMAPNTANPMAAPLTAQQFVSDAAVANMKEVYVSQMALEKSGNAEVKSFAERMIKDHTANNNKLEKVAQNGGYMLPPTNTFATSDANWNNALLNRSDDATIKGQPAEALIMTNLLYVADYKAIRQLQMTSGAQFDQAYVDGMVRDHTVAISEFENASQTLSDPALKKFATKTLPTLRKHAGMARDLTDKLSGQTASIASPNASAMVNP